MKEVSGKNAFTLINERLLQEAQSLVTLTSLDMAEIAFQLNFTDPANFGKWFKKYTGKSPLKFRNHSKI